MIAVLKQQGTSIAQTAKALGRHRSTIYRELSRNRKPYDGSYRPGVAHEQTSGRRRRTRLGSSFNAEQWAIVVDYLRKDWSPEQIAGSLAASGPFKISHETIYKYVWRDKANGGELHKHLRGAAKQRRKRYRSYDSRGRLAGKRHISERPAVVEERSVVGHWEIDTVMGDLKDQHCILTLVERVSGYTMIEKLSTRQMAESARATIALIRRHPSKIDTITADNGTEFHSYGDVEEITGVEYYFATPYHSWERGTNENTNGLIRQYLPKRRSMANLTTRQCRAIERKLNNRPRKRHGYRTPHQVLFGQDVALRS